MKVAIGFEAGVMMAKQPLDDLFIVLDPDRKMIYPWAIIVTTMHELLFAVEEYVRQNPLGAKVNIAGPTPLVSAVNGVIAHQRANALMSKAYDLTWTKNTIDNISSMFYLDIKDLVVENKDFLIIYPGPSLEGCIEYVIEQKHKYTTIALSQTCRVSRRWDWDFVLNIDSQPIVYEHFDGMHDCSTTALFSYCSDSSLRKYRFKERYGFASHGLMDTWIRGLLGDYIPILNCGLTSGSAAIEVAMHLGAKRIITVGSDLAIIGDSRYAWVKEKNYHDAEVLSVDDTMIGTHKDMLSTAQTMSALALGNSHRCQFINCGKGAWLSGWKHTDVINTI